MLLLLLLCVYGVGVVGVVLCVVCVVWCNLLGLCSGFGCDVCKLVLIEWLYECLQQLFGKLLDVLLIFVDLYDVLCYVGELDSLYVISLQMIIICVLYNEFCILLLGGVQFWFLCEEFEQLFFVSVVQWLVMQVGLLLEVEGCWYYYLLQGLKLLVLVVMCMSLSFLLLISVVLLYEFLCCECCCELIVLVVDQEYNVVDSMEGLISVGQICGFVIIVFCICWFFDGGISSNFLIYLFDVVLLCWLIFVINLVYLQYVEDVGCGSDG